jgi:hypothetical protein
MDVRRSHNHDLPRPQDLQIRRRLPHGRSPSPLDYVNAQLTPHQKHEKVWTTIGAPHKLYNSTIVNTQSNAFRNKWVKAGRAAEKATAPNNDGSPGVHVKKRKRADNTTPIRGSGTFAPSPLASDGSTTNTPTASVYNTLTGISDTTPAVPIAPSTPTPPPNSAAQDIEMADAAPVLAKQAKRSNQTEQVATQGFVDKDMNDDAKPQRPAADVDAAEMLLGLRRPS